MRLAFQVCCFVCTFMYWFHCLLSCITNYLYLFVWMRLASCFACTVMVDFFGHRGNNFIFFNNNHSYLTIEFTSSHQTVVLSTVGFAIVKNIIANKWNHTHIFKHSYLMKLIWYIAIQVVFNKKIIQFHLA